MRSPASRLAQAFSPAGTVRPSGLNDMPGPIKPGTKKKKKLPNVGGLGGMTTMKPRGESKRGQKFI